MERGSKHTNIATQELQTVTDPGTRYSEIDARLGDAYQALHQMSQEPNIMQKSIDIAFYRNRIVVLHGIPELFMRGRKRMERSVR